MVLDIALIALYFIIVIIYIKRGFIKSIWGFVRVAAAVAAAYFFGGQFGQWLNDRFILKAVTDTTTGALKPMLTQNNSSFDISELFEKIPRGFTDLIERCGADIDDLEGIFGNFDKASDADVASMAEKISQPISDTISKAAGYVAVFVGVWLIMFIIGQIVFLLSEIPGIDNVNEFLGGVLGVFVGFIYVWIICLLLSIFVENSVVTSSGEALRTITDSSYVFRILCDISPLDFINIKSVLNK